MQKIKHIICGLLAVAMLIGGAVSASAATRIQHTDNSLIGDVDNDNAVKINDATLLQKQLAEISTELDVTNAYTHAVLDANQDNKITIGDVTEIQRYIAELPVAHVSKTIPSTTAHTHVYTTTVEKKLVTKNGWKRTASNKATSMLTLHRGFRKSTTRTNLSNRQSQENSVKSLQTVRVKSGAQALANHLTKRNLAPTKTGYISADRNTPILPSTNISTPRSALVAT